MNKYLTILIIVLFLPLAFVLGLYFGRGNELNKSNNMASDNFRTALQLFFSNISNKRLIIFTENNEYRVTKINDIDISIIPGNRTFQKTNFLQFKENSGNMAAQCNSMVVMLACKMIIDGNPDGAKLLELLQTEIPNFTISAPSLPDITIKSLSSNNAMIKIESDQWQWRFNETK